MNKGAVYVEHIGGLFFAQRQRLVAVGRLALNALDNFLWVFARVAAN